MSVTNHFWNMKNTQMYDTINIDRLWSVSVGDKKAESASEVVDAKIDILLNLRNSVVRQKFLNRTDKIRSVCAEEGKREQPLRQGIILRAWSVEPNYKLMMCRTAKHGSTSWAKNFVKIYTEGKGGGSQIRLRKLEEKVGFTDEEKEKTIQTTKIKDHDYLSFFVCRNPIEKLLSVYKYMVDMTNSNSTTFRERSDFPKGGATPTWERFIFLLATTTERNYLGLTRPMYLGCEPCTFSFDAVIKMETYDSDSREILERSGLAWLAPAHENNHGSHSLDPGDVTKVFSKSRKEDVRAIIEKYRLDFQLCGYEQTLEELTLISGGEGA